jgi:hypothetical protein
MMVRSLVLFVHSVSMLVLFGGMGVEWLILGALRRSTTQQQASLWLRVWTALPPVIGTSVGLILVSGIYMTVRSELYRAGWVRVSFGAMILMSSRVVKVSSHSGIELEQAAQAIATVNGPALRRYVRRRKEEKITFALVSAFKMMMFNVLGQCAS